MTCCLLAPSHYLISADLSSVGCQEILFVWPSFLRCQCDDLHSAGSPFNNDFILTIQFNGNFFLLLFLSWSTDHDTFTHVTMVGPCTQFCSNCCDRIWLKKKIIKFELWWKYCLWNRSLIHTYMGSGNIVITAPADVLTANQSRPSRKYWLLKNVYILILNCIGHHWFHDM